MSNTHILIVEDQKIIAKIFSILLEKKGFTVTITSSANEAIAKIKELTPLLTLMDVQLNEKLTGIDVARTARAEGYTNKIIFTTGNVLDNTKHAVEDIDNCVVLIKPVQLYEIEKYLSN